MDQPVETWTVRIDADTSDFQKQLSAATGSGRQFSRALTTAFQGVAVEGKGVTDTLRSLALSLSQMTLQAAFKPLGQVASGALQNLLGGGLGSGLGLGGAGAGGAMPVPFASGGVISSPIAFPLCGRRNRHRRRTRRRGDHAARARTRRAARREADGGGRNVSVTFNVTTPGRRQLPAHRDARLAAMLGPRRRAGPAQPVTGSRAIRDDRVSHSPPIRYSHH